VAFKWPHFISRFFFSILCCSQIGNHPQEDLANFGCRPDVKVEGFDKLGQFSKEKSFAYVEIIFFRLRKMQTLPPK
jgi:hypothetical protein